MDTPYKRSKVGNLLGWGGEHVVYTYGEHEVIKYSWWILLSGKHGVARLLEDYHVGEHYFGPYMHPTDIRTWNDGSSAIEIQPKLTCRALDQSDLEDQTILTQFRDILARDQHMYAELGYSFDMFGFKGLLGRRPHREVANILVTPEKKLVLIDFTTLRVTGVLIELPIGLFIRMARVRQKYLLNRFWLPRVKNTL